MRITATSLLCLGLVLVYLSQQISSAPCGACKCFYRTRFVSCAMGKSDEIYETLRAEDMAWVQSLDLRSVEGTLDTHFYIKDRFPDLHDVDFRGNCIRGFSRKNDVFERMIRSRFSFFLFENLTDKTNEMIVICNLLFVNIHIFSLQYI